MKKTHKLTDEQKNEIFQKYLTGEYTCKKLADEYKIGKSSVCGLLKRKNITVFNNQSILQRKYALNEQYFDIIDTEEKAYFLGLLYADGCNHTKKNVVVINLQEIDKDILDKLKESLNYKKPLTYINSTNLNRKNQYRLHITSKYMSSQLERLGCIPKKSLLLTFPSEEQVPNYLYRHFIRGYFDGDGCIYINKNNKITTSLCSTLDFCNSVKKIIKDKCKCCIHKTNSAKLNNTNTRILVINNQNDNKIFLDWLYQNCSIYLERKYQKYLKYYST